MLKERMVTAVVLIIVAIALLFKASDAVWLVAILFIGAVMAWEWSGFARLHSFGGKVFFTALVVTLSWLGAQWLSIYMILGLTIAELGLVLWVVLRYQLSQASKGLESKGWVLISGALMIMLFSVTLLHFRHEFSPWIILLSLLVIWAVDTGAYFSGRRFGKTKLALYVSPGKTWEGVLGGVVLAFIVGLFSLLWLAIELSIPVWLFAMALAMVALISVLGDLFESVLKRQVKLKDSGHILPGHGGVLDRGDSLLIAVPMLYLLWYFGRSV